MFTMLGVALLAVLCCAGPALVAGGALSAIGAAVRSPWLIAAGAVLVVAAAGYTLARHRRRHVGACAAGSDECCPPQTRTKAGLDNRSTDPAGSVQEPRGSVEKRTRR
jgi:mercuric ion transport protein